MTVRQKDNLPTRQSPCGKNNIFHLQVQLNWVIMIIVIRTKFAKILGPKCGPMEFVITKFDCTILGHPRDQ